MDGVIEYEYTESTREEHAPVVPASSPAPLPVPDAEENEGQEDDVEEEGRHHGVDEEDGVYEGDEEEPEVEPYVETYLGLQDLDMLACFRSDLDAVCLRLQDNHMDYFLAGAVLVNHFPVLGWLLTTYIFSIPTFVAVQNLKWINNKEINLLHLMTILGLTIGTETYAIYCLTRVINLTADINSHLLV
jgi:hypothetical protein